MDRINQNATGPAVVVRELQPDEDPRYLDGPWNNDACKGYAIMAMERAGLNAETIRKVSQQMTWCFDDATVEEAKRHYYGGPY